MESKDARIEPLEGPEPLTVCGGMILNPPHEGDRPIRRALVGPSAVAHRLRQPVTELEAALVAERDRVPSAGFQDHQLIGWTPAHEMTGPARTALFLDRADDGEAAGGAGRVPRYRRDGGGQRALGVDRAATKEALALAAHRDEARDGIDVAEEEDF